MHYISLGNSDIQISRIGLGCMGMSEFYGATDEAESLATLHAALELGLTFFDTSDAYGDGESERLLSKAFAGKRNRVVLATKCGVVRDSTTGSFGINGTPAYVKQACERSLQRLGPTTLISTISIVLIPLSRLKRRSEQWRIW